MIRQQDTINNLREQLLIKETLLAEKSSYESRSYYSEKETEIPDLFWFLLILLIILVLAMLTCLIIFACYMRRNKFGHGSAMGGGLDGS